VEITTDATTATCPECDNPFKQSIPIKQVRVGDVYQETCPDCFRKAVMASPLAGHYARYEQFKNKRGNK
jgi:cytochrome c5